MANNGNFDLSGVFHIQEKYLFDLSNSYPNVNNAPKLAMYVNDLQTKMKELSKQFAESNTSSSAVLDHQKKMISIVKDEKDRLLKKKQLVDAADAEQQRLMMLNDSYRKKYTQYTKIVIIIVVALIIYLLLQFAASFVSDTISDWFAILYAIDIVVAIVFIIYVYADIYSRSNINYDELNLPPPNKNSASGGGFDTSGNGFGKFGMTCYGKNCCAPGTVWDDKRLFCTTPSDLADSRASIKTPSKQGFTTIEGLPYDRFNANNIILNPGIANQQKVLSSVNVKPASSSEYDKYSKI
jgi:hypothetical protein